MITDVQKVVSKEENVKHSEAWKQTIVIIIYCKYVMPNEWL